MKKIVIILTGAMALLMGVWLQQNVKTDFITLDNQEHRWSELNKQWVVVSYFAEWCAPCLREMPELNHFYQQYNDDIAIFAISYDPLSKEQLSVLQQQHDIQFPIITRLNKRPWVQPPTSLPRTYILDADGNVKKQIKGEVSAEKLIRIITSLKAL